MGEFGLRSGFVEALNLLGTWGISWVMVRVEIVDEFTTGLQEWEIILRRLGVDVVACAGYEVVPFGVPKADMHYDLIDLFSLERYSKGRDLGPVFALSSLVGLGILGHCEGFREEPWWHTNLLALLGLDFDCPVGESNTVSILTAVGSFPGSWSLLETGGSCHLVGHDLVPVAHVPYHYGRVIGAFAGMTDGGSEMFFRRVGKWLRMGWKDRLVVRWIESEILANVVHWSDRKPGYRQFIDTRHLAYSMREWRMFMNQRLHGFGFLRVGPKEPGGKGPFLRARKSSNGVVVYKKMGELG